MDSKPDRDVEYFRKQGKLGGQKRAKNLTAAQRKEIARAAAQARWDKRRKDWGQE